MPVEVSVQAMRIPVVLEEESTGSGTFGRMTQMPGRSKSSIGEPLGTGLPHGGGTQRGRRARRFELVAIGIFKQCPRPNGRGPVSRCRMEAVRTAVISFARLIPSAILQPKEDEDEDGQDGKDGGDQRQQGAVPRDSPVARTDGHEGAESGEKCQRHHHEYPSEHRQEKVPSAVNADHPQRHDEEQAAGDEGRRGHAHACHDPVRLDGPAAGKPPFVPDLPQQSLRLEIERSTLGTGDIHVEAGSFISTPTADGWWFVGRFAWTG
ncbi:MAG: hypothetical protein CL917_00105, partial [Deltaproteobacteria bacterium]|nr:hypothetical protein [Deltaproteobacteria bacterium]